VTAHTCTHSSYCTPVLLTCSLAYLPGAPSFHWLVDPIDVRSSSCRPSDSVLHGELPSSNRLRRSNRRSSSLRRASKLKPFSFLPVVPATDPSLTRMVNLPVIPATGLLSKPRIVYDVSQTIRSFVLCSQRGTILRNTCFIANRSSIPIARCCCY